MLASKEKHALIVQAIDQLKSTLRTVEHVGDGERDLLITYHFSEDESEIHQEFVDAFDLATAKLKEAKTLLASIRNEYFLESNR